MPFPATFTAVKRALYSHNRQRRTSTGLFATSVSGFVVVRRFFWPSGYDRAQSDFTAGIAIIGINT